MNAVVFCGIQATGKSTFFRERFSETHVRLNMDMLRTRHREEILLRACIEAKQPFVVDNTNATAAERARYIAAAKEGKFRVIGYYFESRIHDAMRRNEARPDADRVPAKGVLGCYGRLVLPWKGEGFDELYRVNIDEVGRFNVVEWEGREPQPEPPARERCDEV